MELIESQIQCSGICSQPREYILYGLDKGVPPQTCVKEMKYFLAENANKFKWPIIGLFLVPLLTMILVFGSCCLDKKKYEDDITFYKQACDEYA